MNMRIALMRTVNFLRRGITPAGLLCIMTGLLGCVAVYNATFHLAHPFRYVTRQFVWLFPAFLTLIITAGASAARHKSIGVVVAVGLYAALWGVLVLGVRVNGMRGWFAWHGIFVQPSELGKPAFVLLLAGLITSLRQRNYDIKREFLVLLAFLAAWVLPISLQPDFGTMLVYIFAFAATYICAGGRVRYLAGAGAAALPFGFISFWLNPYLTDRFLAFLRPAEYAHSAAWHIQQFQLTLASGGLFGRSWGEGVQTQNYLPLGYSDSVFATLGEAIGFLGVLPFIVLILAYVLYVYRAIQRAADGLHATVMLGAVFILVGQAFLHLSVNLGIFPPTGLPLPLISYGGSSLVATLALIGLVESMSRTD